ncbi:MAG: alpha/beta fold hydrolase [Phycisphaerae bacterium]
MSIRLTTIAMLAMLLIGCAQQKHGTWTHATAAENKLHFVNDRSDRALVYRDTGPRPTPLTYVFIHGLGSSKAAWRFLLDELPGDPRIVLLDMLGHGESSKPVNFEYGMSAQADAVVDLLRHLDLANVILVGSSMGGGVAMEAAYKLARCDSPLVRGIVLIAGTAAPFDPPASFKRSSDPLTRWLLLNAADSRDVAARMLRGAYLDDSQVDDARVREMAYPLDQRAARLAIISSARELFDELAARRSAGARYAAIKVPVLLLWGSHDSVVPQSVMFELAREISGASIAIVVGCGHLPAEELPLETAAVIENWLDESKIMPAQGQ